MHQIFAISYLHPKTWALFLCAHRTQNFKVNEESFRNCMAVFGKWILLFCRQFTFLPKGKSCFSQDFVFYFVPSTETVIRSFLVILYTVLDNTTVDGRYISLNFRRHFSMASALHNISSENFVQLNIVYKSTDTTCTPRQEKGDAFFPVRAVRKIRFGPVINRKLSK
jgi:hypothetical protein